MPEQNPDTDSLFSPRPLRYLSGYLNGLVQERLWLKVLIGMFLGLITGVILGPSVGLVEPETGATIGILGGGQLGRMLSVAASRLGFKTCIYDPAGDCPASHVSNYHVKAAYEDEAALRAFSEAVDVITYEFENIPTSALDLLEAGTPIRPGRRVLAVSQDRLTEKAFLSEQGLGTAPFAAVDDEVDLALAQSIENYALRKEKQFIQFS